MVIQVRVICLVKFVPDVEAFQYDSEKKQLIRENVKTIINPDDASALAAALRLKKQYGLSVELVTMGPVSVKPKLRDYIRIGADKAVLISDAAYSGSDTYATSLILGDYLRQAKADIILTGTHTIDGDTAHVPAQIAERIDYSFLSGITKLEEQCMKDHTILCSVELDECISHYSLELPALLAVSRESRYSPPYVSYADLDRYVDDKIEVVTNAGLNIPEERIGLKGSRTRVVDTYTKALETRQRTIVSTDDEGIEYVYQFLKEKGFVDEK
ncbi:electron transfer flavoprotein subunit beta [[Clostridium] hylemonae]|nr:electron transfer flavoprotein subunit beta [[Clostridium] hylemonae]